MTDRLRQELTALGRDQADHERFELAFARLLPHATLPRPNPHPTTWPTLRRRRPRPLPGGSVPPAHAGDHIAEG
jgi:hypothetical protein